MKKLIFLFILVLLMFLSCGKKEDKKSENTKEYTEILVEKPAPEPPSEPPKNDTAIPSEQAIEKKDKSIDDILKEALPSGNGDLAILIDDSGSSMELAKEFQSLDMRISFAVMPYLAKSKEVSEYLTANGHTVILHLPMEGSDTAVNEKTKDLLKTEMTKDEMLRIFDAALSNVGPVRGFNNHMGSVFTNSPEAMETILSHARDKKLFYVDSKTIGSSKGYETAKNMRIPTAQCMHFVDNNKDVLAIEKELIIAAKIAKKRGRALVIGHFHKNMVEALRNVKTTLENSGIRLVFVDEILQ